MHQSNLGLFGVIQTFGNDPEIQNTQIGAPTETFGGGNTENLGNTNTSLGGPVFDYHPKFVQRSPESFRKVHAKKNSQNEDRSKNFQRESSQHRISSNNRGVNLDFNNQYVDGIDENHSFYSAINGVHTKNPYAQLQLQNGVQDNKMEGDDNYMPQNARYIIDTKDMGEVPTEKISIVPQVRRQAQRGESQRIMRMSMKIQNPNQHPIPSGLQTPKRRGDTVKNRVEGTEARKTASGSGKTNFNWNQSDFSRALNGRGNRNHHRLSPQITGFSQQQKQTNGYENGLKNVDHNVSNNLATVATRPHLSASPRSPNGSLAGQSGLTENFRNQRLFHDGVSQIPHVSIGKIPARQGGPKFPHGGLPQQKAGDHHPGVSQRFSQRFSLKVPTEGFQNLCVHEDQYRRLSPVPQQGFNPLGRPRAMTYEETDNQFNNNQFGNIGADVDAKFQRRGDINMDYSMNHYHPLNYFQGNSNIQEEPASQLSKLHINSIHAHQQNRNLSPREQRDFSPSIAPSASEFRLQTVEENNRFHNPYRVAQDQLRQEMAMQQHDQLQVQRRDYSGQPVNRVNRMMTNGNLIFQRPNPLIPLPNHALHESWVVGNIGIIVGGNIMGGATKNGKENGKGSGKKPCIKFFAGPGICLGSEDWFRIEFARVHPVFIQGKRVKEFVRDGVITRGENRAFWDAAKRHHPDGPSVDVDNDSKLIEKPTSTNQIGFPEQHSDTTRNQIHYRFLGWRDNNSSEEQLIPGQRCHLGNHRFWNNQLEKSDQRYHDRQLVAFFGESDGLNTGGGKATNRAPNSNCMIMNVNRSMTNRPSRPSDYPTQYSNNYNSDNENKSEQLKQKQGQIVVDTKIDSQIDNSANTIYSDVYVRDYSGENWWVEAERVIIRDTGSYVSSAFLAESG